MAGKVSVGVVGLGGIGNYHCNSIVQNPKAELVALFDSNSEATAAAAQKYPGTRECASFQEFLDTPGMQAVVIGTPNNTHAELTIAAAKRKMHVFCEKPIAMDAKEAARMVKAIQDNRVVGMANFGYRAGPSFRYAPDLMGKKALGRVHRVRAEFIQGFLRDPNAPITWRNLKKYAGLGTLGDLGSHLIDAVAYITGTKPKRAIGIHKVNVPTKMNPATGKKARVTADTDAQFMVDYGAFVAQFETSQVSYGPDVPLRVTMDCEKAAFRVSAGDSANFEISRDSKELARTEVPKKHQKNIPFGSQFIDAILGKTRDYPSLADGLLVQKALDAIDLSMDSGRWESV